MRTKSILLVLVSVLVVISGAIWLYLWLTTATVIINTTAGNAVYVKAGSDSDFREIGQGTTVYKTRSEDTLFIEARSEDSITQKAVSPKRRQTVDVTIETYPTIESSYIGQGPLAYPFISGGFIYGINPHNNSLSVKPMKGYESKPLPGVANLPYLKQVVWFGPQNYFYVTLGQGAGFMTGSRDNVTEKPYVAAALAGNQLALVAGDGLFLTRPKDPNYLEKIADAIGGSSPGVFADDDQIYYINLIYNPTQSEGEEPTPKETRLALFSPEGKEMDVFTLQITEPVHKVTSIGGNSLALLTSTGLSVLDTDSGQVNSAGFSFGRVEDVLVHRGRVFLLGGQGLWEYSRTESEFHKLASYNDGEEYVPNSLFVQGGSLYFSTSIKDEELLKTGSTARSGFYRVAL